MDENTLNSVLNAIFAVIGILPMLFAVGVFLIIWRRRGKKSADQYSQQAISGYQNNTSTSGSLPVSNTNSSTGSAVLNNDYHRERFVQDYLNSKSISNQNSRKNPSSLGFFIFPLLFVIVAAGIASLGYVQAQNMENTMSQIRSGEGVRGVATISRVSGTSSSTKRTYYAYFTPNESSNNEASDSVNSACWVKTETGQVFQESPECSKAIESLSSQEKQNTLDRQEYLVDGYMLSYEGSFDAVLYNNKVYFQDLKEPGYYTSSFLSFASIPFGVFAFMLVMKTWRHLRRRKEQTRQLNGNAVQNHI